MEFEWDPRKAEQNYRKHRVSFEEATTIFRDTLSITIHDPEHSIGEERYITVGISINSNLLIVSHLDKNNGEIVRIISARQLTTRERKAFEEGYYE